MADSLPVEDLKNALLELLRQRGGRMGNQMAQQLLGCSDEVYQTTKTALLDAGLIAKGRGKGGSIFIPNAIDTPSPSIRNEKELASPPTKPTASTLEFTENLREDLQSFGQQAQSKKDQYCRNEARTKQSLIDPYLLLLDVDTRDPEQVTVEYETGIGKGVERVDYAVLEAGKPIWLIEAKSARDRLPDQLPDQLKRYVVDTKASFAALTNGIHWHWYMWGDNRGLEETPFLKIDVRDRPAKPELDWLATVRRGGLHGPDAEQKARACRMARYFIGWLGSVVKNPSLELRYLALRECGLSTNETYVQLASIVLPEAWEHFIGTESQSGSDLVSHLSVSVGETTSHAPSITPRPGGTVNTDDSVEPVEGRSSRKREARYRFSQDQDWINCKDATVLMQKIMEWCAGENKDGANDYYERLRRVQIHNLPLLIQNTSEKWDRPYSKKIENGWRIFNNLANKQKPDMINKILDVCIKRDGTRPVQGQDLWVEIPNDSLI